MASVEFSPNQATTEAITAHVLWITVGLSCEGDSVAMTSATNPSLEDIITGAIPGMPTVVIHNQVIAYEVGMDFIQAWFDAEAGKLSVDADGMLDWRVEGPVAACLASSDLSAPQLLASLLRDMGAAMRLAA